MGNINEKLKILPDKPGVYIMKNQNDEIIYVGKAISLKNRVRQYFQSSRGHSPKVKVMVSNITDFEYIITDSELEALILECNLIKKHRPKYNVLLKDDKHYPYIKVTTEETYPRVMLTRRIVRDKNKYFGPYTSSRAVKDTIEAIKKIFPIRTCNKSVGNGKRIDRPCLNYHIKQCLGPCQGNVSKDEYMNMIKDVCRFLDGRQEDLLNDLRVNMAEASRNLQFEKAAVLRDRILAVEKILEGQKIISTNMEDQDILAFAQDEANTVMQVFFVRKGKLVAAENFTLEDIGTVEGKEIISSFIKQYYLSIPFIPREIIIQEDIEGSDTIERWLGTKKGGRVYIKSPKKGEKRKLVEMAEKNAREVLVGITLKAEREYARTMGAVEELARYLGMDIPPHRIEAYDISNFQGTDSVASMVVFEDGKPKNKHYRRFKIKSVEGPDDFASMAEVITRRFTRGLEEKKDLKSKGRDMNSGKFSKFPNLVLIDGGKGQLSSALRILKSLGVDYIPAIGLAKENEEIYMEGRNDPIIIPKNSNALHLIQRIRDEAHRFAITYHKSLRKKGSLNSVLEDIPAIGPKRRKALFKHFGSIDEIIKADFDELLKVDGMDKRAAANIKDYLKG